MTEPAPRQRRRRRWPWVVAAVLALAFLLRGPLLAPVVTRVAADQLAAAIAGQATVASAGGGWFGDLHLDGISAEAPLGPVPHLRIARLSASYGLGIVRGDLAALRTLHLDGVEATIDLRGAAAAADAAGGDHAVPPVLELLPMPLPEASLHGEVRLRLAQGDVLLSDLHLLVAPRSVSLAAEVRVDAAAPVHVAATFSRTAADTLVLDQAVVLGDATVETLELVLGRQQQRLGAALRLGAGRLVLRADPARVAVTASGLDLAAVPAAALAFLPVELGALHGTLAGEATALRAAKDWNVAGALRVTGLSAAGVGPFTLAAQGHLGAGSIQLPQLSLTGPGDGRMDFSDVRIAFADGRPAAGTVQVEIPDLRSWLPGSIALPPTTLALSAQLAFAGRALVITSSRLAGGGVTTQLRGSIVPQPWRIEAAAVESTADLALLAPLIPGAPNLAGLLHGRLGGSLPLSGDPATLLGGAVSMELRADTLTIGANDLTGLRVAAHTADGRLQLDQAEVASAGVGVVLAGSAALHDATLDATVERLAVSLPGTVATALAPFTVQVAAGRFRTGSIRLHSDAGDVALEAGHADGRGFLRVQAPQVELARLGLPGLAGQLGLALDLNGSWLAPQGSVRLQAAAVTFAGHRADATLDLAQDQGGLAIREGIIEAGADGRAVLSGTLPFTLGAAGATAVPDDGRPAAITLELPALAPWLPQVLASGAARLHLEFGRTDDPAAVVGELAVTGVRGVVTGSEAQRRSAATATLAGTIGIRGDAAGVGLAVRVLADGRQVMSGELHAPGAWEPALLRGGWRQRPLSGALALDGLELRGFAAAIPELRHLAGRADGALTLGGTSTAPVLAGSLSLSGLEAKIGSDIPTLSAGEVRLELVGSTVRLLSGVVELGGSPVTAAGTLSLAEPRRLDLRLDGRNALLVQRHDARVRADLALTLSGPFSAVTLAGTAVVTNALFSPDLNLWGGGGAAGDGRLVPFEFTTRPLSELRFDVQVSSAFSDRNDGVRLATGLVRADCDLDLHLGGTGTAPELGGRIVVRKGKVVLPFSTLRLTTGEILFPPGDPFHPRLNAVASAQVRRYAVTLQVDGPLADPQVRASGDGLDQSDALLLLTTGATNAELSGEEGQRAALGRLGSWVGLEAWDYIDGESDPDAAPGVMERVTLDFGRQVSDSGKDTIEAQVELTDPEERPEVLIFGERDRWDDYNAGLILRFRWAGEE